MNNTLLKPNYDLGRYVFYVHHGTIPHYYFAIKPEERNSIYVLAVGRFGQYNVIPFFSSAYGFNANFPIYETQPIAIPRNKM